jgi:hypothetical protein
MLLEEVAATSEVIVRPSGAGEGWERIAHVKPQPIPDDTSRWSEGVEACAEWVVVIDGLYGPVACVLPGPSFEPLESSPGIPAYVEGLLETYEGSGEDLQETLQAIEDAFRLEARLTILNEGDETAQEIVLVGPPEWTYSTEVRPRRGTGPCKGSGENENEDFSLAPLQRCGVAYVGETASRGMLPLTPPPFEAVPETPPLLDAVVGTLIVAAAFMVLYAIADGVVNWGKRTGG